MTGRIPSAETKAWICTADDCASVKPQLQQYFCWLQPLTEALSLTMKSCTMQLVELYMQVLIEQ